MALCDGVFAQLQPCAPDPGCIVIAAEAPAGAFNPDDEVAVSLAFRPALDDGQEGGPDEIAAVSLSLAIPGLALADCSGIDENGLSAAFTIAPAIAEGFVVFVENTRCLARTDCLCPQVGQGRDSFINLVLSPRTVSDPEPPPVAPVLPDGELLIVRLRVRQDAPATVRLHVFSEVDDPQELPKPEFAGFVTAGDRLAVDQTADRGSNTSRIRLVDDELLVAGGATPTPTASVTHTATATGSATATASATDTVTPGPSPTSTNSPTVTPTTDPNATPTPTSTATMTRTASPTGECAGDCDGDGVVSIEELVKAVAISFEAASVDDCSAVDVDGDRMVGVDELIRAVRVALASCPP